MEAVHTPGNVEPCSLPHQGARVLVVDDEPTVRHILCRWLTQEGYVCQEASDGAEALRMLHTGDYSLLITDVRMPRLDGMSLLDQGKVINPHLAVIMVTAVDDRETATRALQHGAYGYIIKPFDRNEVFINVANALERRRLMCLSEEYERDLEEKVRQRTEEIRQREEEITLHLVSAAEYRDDETGAHIRRMALYAAALAEALGWPPEQVDILRLAAPMHDIGKIGIPDYILLKPDKLSTEEFEIMKRHTVIGTEILASSRIPLLQMASEIAMYHHERWNGTGYPHGLTGETIPECARIVALADVYDALLTDRVYRPAFSEQETLTIMSAGKGVHFDPLIFECAMDIYATLHEIRQAIDHGSLPGGITLDLLRDMTAR